MDDEIRSKGGWVWEGGHVMSGVNPISGIWKDA